jgi:RNA polymerase sigma-70 factor (ECF subfamily)
MAFDHSLVSGGGNFPQTRWSVIAAAGSDDSAERSRALDVLFTAYWKPAYKYIRWKFSKAPDEAQDLTQGFFMELFERDLLSRFDGGKSRLRTYIRMCVDSFVLNEIKHAGRQKRGGGALHLALDFPAAEGELNAQTIDPASIPSPEQFEEFFEKEWIRSLFSWAVEDLRQLCEIHKRPGAFSLFEIYDLSGDETWSYAKLAEQGGLSVSECNQSIGVGAARNFAAWRNCGCVRFVLRTRNLRVNAGRCLAEA